MIKSITFTDEKSGYINEIRYKRVYLEENEDEKPGTDSSTEKSPIEKLRERRYYRRENFDEVPDGYANEQLRRTLLKKTFTFSADKPNLIVGYNGAGKSTIIKTIATYALCGESSYMLDGWTNYKKIQPLDYGLEEKPSIKRLIEICGNNARNKAVLDWPDRAPVFFNNFAKRQSFANGEFGMLRGGIITSMEDEVGWIINRGKTSVGERAKAVIGLMTDQLREPLKTFQMNEDFDNYWKRLLQENEEKTKEDCWYQAQKTCLDYLSEGITEDTEQQATVLIDELDHGLDVLSVYEMYGEYIPKLQSKLGCQVICTSHSPIVLSNEVSEKYNIISLDDEYTEQVIDLMKKLTY